MNSLDTFQKRLHDETATVEQEIESHKQQLETLNRRLEGLKRAAELFESEQGAISALLHTSTANGGVMAKPAATSRPADAQKRRAPQSRPKSAGIAPRIGSQNGGPTRVDMIAAVLKRHPHRSVRELIALLNKEDRGQTTESAVTGHLYTRPDKFVHTPPDRAANRPVTWSSK
jgi:hypothetical protein